MIEWENAIDVGDKWTRSAMAALERELADVGSKMTEKPRVPARRAKRTRAAA